MKKSSLLAVYCLCFLFSITGQVAINTDATNAHGSAMLDIKSNNKGFLPPRMNWTQIQAIQNPAEGLVVYDVGLKALRLYSGSSWIVLGPKEYDLFDPPGNFGIVSTVLNSSSSPSSMGWNVAIGNNKRACVIMTYSDTTIIGTDTLEGNSNAKSMIACYDESANYLWGNSFPLSNATFADLIIDVSGNIYTCGWFIGAIDLDFGPGVDNHDVGLTTGAFFAKYDPNGNLIWGRHLQSSSDITPNEIQFDESGNCFLTGYLFGTADMDPGVGVQNLVSSGYDIYFAKYDNLGNWVWSKKVGGTGSELTSQLRLLNGTVILAGTFEGTSDFDPSAGTFNLVSAGMSDFFFARYDGAGNFLWAKRIGGTGGEFSPRIATDPNGNIVLAGNYNSPILDIDPDAGVLNFGTAGGVDFYIAKYAGSGALVPGWHFKVGSSENQFLNKLETDAAGAVYASGYFYGSADFDPGSAFQQLASFGARDAFLVKYTDAGNFVYAKSLGGGYEDEAFLAVHPEGKLIYCTGSTQAAPWKSFNGERSFSLGYYLVRYEE